MTVKEVFELRKQGRIDEAYEAIRPMYAVHKGKYTTLCMFWTASDMLKKKLQEGQTEEARKIFNALLRVQSSIDDHDGKVHQAVMHDALRLKEALPTFSMLDFVEHYGAERLADADWQGTMSTPPAGNSERPHLLPSTAQRLLTHCFHEIQQHPGVELAFKAMPLLQEAVRRNPRDKHNLRYMAIVYTIMGEREKAVPLYRQLLSRYHDSYLYAELADLTDEPGPKAALLCQAIAHQRQEKFCMGYRVALARLLAGHDNARAAYELQKCLATRRALGYAITHDLRQLEQRIGSVQPATDSQQQDFYRRMAAKYPL